MNHLSPEQRPLRKHYLSYRTKNLIKKLALGFGLVVGGASIPIGGYLIKNHYWPEKPRVSFEEVKIRKTTKVPVKDKRTAILDNQIPCATFGYKDSSHTITNQQGKKEDLGSFLRRSKPEAINYAKQMIAKAKKEIYDKQNNISDLELAIKTIDLVWKDITTKASYSKDYEVKAGEITYSKGKKSDSRQTFKEFCTPKDKTGKCLGDCDDYSNYVLIAYEVIRDLAEKGRGNNPFMQKLAAGLWRYQMLGVKHSGHVMLATLTYSPSFNEVEISPFEPQTYSKSGNKKSFFFGEYDGRLLLWDSSGDKEVVIYEIQYLFNSTGACEPK